MSELSRRSGVPAPTIKHYIREGLLPEPAVRTSPNMAYYDAGLVNRIKTIKELQRSRFLPLKVIKDILDGASAGPDDENAVNAIAKVLKDTSPTVSMRREQLIESGVPADDLDWYKAEGIAVPEEVDGEEVYKGDDLSLIQTVNRARAAGITEEILPRETLKPYRDMVSQLTRFEVAMFRKDVLPIADQDLERIVEESISIGERLIVLFRRKSLIPQLTALLDDESAS